MVNYVLSFCKITGASKIFTRNFYLPLLKPLTPKDALRTLRITGKWLLGAKYQHYIPVLRNHRFKTKSKAKKHKTMDDFTYMTPTFDPDNENQKRLKNILDSKPKSPGLYVYTVEDKKYNIVFEAAFELAVQDGDIIDVLVSQKNDKILVKTKDFKKVPLEIQYYEPNGQPLYSGQGTTTKEEEKFHHHGKYTMGLAKLFEDKEMQEEKWEEEMKKILKKRKKHKWEGTKAFKEMMKQIMRKFDWKKFEEDAKRVIDDIDAPVTETPIAMEINDLEATKHVNETLSQREELLDQLPTLKDIPDIIKNLGQATLTDLETDSRTLKGAKVTLASGKECFISGQMVHTEDGDVFVPGQTIQNEFGAEYAPGITINIDSKPTLVNGLIMGDEQKDPLFLPTQSTITSGGQLTFATAPEERPAPEPEEQRQTRRKKLLRIISVVPEENEQEEIKECIEDIMKESGVSDFENIEIIVESVNDQSSSSDEDDTVSSEELNHEELDIEAIHLKQRQELEKLKMILQDDGMNDLISSLEEKKLLLKKKLEELRKLSMISESNLISYVDDSDAMDAATKITSQDIKKLSEVLIAITRRTANFRDRNGIRLENINLDVNIKPTEWDEKFNKSSMKLKVLLKTALVAANDVYKNRPKDQVLALHSIVDILEDSLKSDPKLLGELLKLLETSTDRLEVCDTVLKQLTLDISHTKVACLKNLTQPNLNLQDCLKNLDKIIEDGIMNTSFTKIVKLCPEIIQDLSNTIKIRSKGVIGEEAAMEILQDSIVATTRALMESNFEVLLSKKESTVLEFIEEALSFAKALDLEDVVENLSKPKTALNNLEECSIEMLKRMTLIRQLAEKDYSLKTAISRIKKNPECARSDPRIRQLIRESAIVMSEMAPLRNSRDIPYDMMKKQNLLSIEDFLMRKMRLDVPVLVSRGTYQAVIPKESARGVLAGRVPYILIDESGVTNFKPMHMLSSINVNKNREKRIEDYLSGVRERSKSIDLNQEDSRTYLQAKSNSPDGQYAGTARGRAMSSGALLGHRL
ncbi:putative leucine-rich repeat-containing protein DDB_G0290503 [Anthonomus grandis grandis]|uniref:putative leucine-rich repeat-containing protein DDB_G0290503 n=1 Tax=Anthonomus grandis grandis TaxID=2921223 RepID=UPI00216589F9|nr:putative leucine-rich repeat-containing protein DDB_G0290503 [Anthonomus grandis grandis]